MVVILPEELIMWHPSPHQPPCPSRRSKSQNAAIGSIPRSKCLKPIVRGLVRFPKLHPSAKATNWIREMDWKTLYWWILCTELHKCLWVYESNVLNYGKQSSCHIFLSVYIEIIDYIQIQKSLLQFKLIWMTISACYIVQMI